MDYHRRIIDADLDDLFSLWLLDPVPAWIPTGSFLTRLGQTPEHHLADPALAARLLRLDRDALLDGGGTAIGPHARKQW
jgi:hypothetical protein